MCGGGWGRVGTSGMQTGAGRVGPKGQKGVLGAGRAGRHVYVLIECFGRLSLERKTKRGASITKIQSTPQMFTDVGHHS
jgi:hypothetical protein